MHVLHLIPSLGIKSGGPTTAVIGLATAQAREGLQVSVLSTFNRPEEAVTPDGLDTRDVHLKLVGPTTGVLRRHRDLAEVVDSYTRSCDFLHVHAVWEQLQYEAARAAKRHRKPFIFTPHGMLTGWSLRQSKWRKKLMLALRVKRAVNRATAIHFTSRQEEEETKAAITLQPPALIETLGVNLSEFRDLPPRGRFRARYPQIGNSPLIVFLGRIHPGKGLEHLIPAFAASEIPAATLVIVGPDSAGYRQEMERLVQKHDIGDRTIFTGMLTGKDRIEALVDADLYCLPSDHENFGMAVVEALAVGTPVIVSNKTAIWQEIVAAGVGAAVDPDPGALVPVLRQWMVDDKLRATAASKASSFAAEHYDLTAIARRWVTHYEHLSAQLNGGDTPRST